MKRFKVLNVLVLILLLCITGCSQSQDQNKTEETADDLLIKFIEYFDKGDMNAAFNCLNKALELDPTKLVYIGRCTTGLAPKIYPNTIAAPSNVWSASPNLIEAPPNVWGDLPGIIEPSPNIC